MIDDGSQRDFPPFIKVCIRSFKQRSELSQKAHFKHYQLHANIPYM